MKTFFSTWRPALGAALLLQLAHGALPHAATAQTGVSDERVSLPDGPGSIGGVGENADVDPNMGSMSYSVPIEVPEGETTAMTPSLSLQYSSNSGMGLLGIGWTLLTPSIERTTSRGLPTYTTSDIFAADGGSQLVYVGDEGGARVYRARYEGAFVRYKWFNAGNAGYWVAELPDGRVATYGATAAGVIVPTARIQNGSGDTFRYELVEMVDPSGRRMVQTWTKDASGMPLLDEVRYAFGTGATPRFSVRLGYEARPDTVSDAVSGEEVLMNRRVSEVRVLSNTTTIRRYVLTYENVTTSGGASRLAGVTQFGRDGGQHGIAFSFEYSRTLGGTCASGCEQPFMVDMGSIGVDLATGNATLIDINGDSLPDVLTTDPGDGSHRFFIARLDVNGRPTFSAGSVTSNGLGGNSTMILSAPGVQVLDVNGDGFADLVNAANESLLCNDGSGDWNGTACSGTDDGFPALTADADPEVEPNPLNVRFFDYDNDKRIDMIRTVDGSTVQVHRNTGNGFNTILLSSGLDGVFDPVSGQGLELADMNGDGLQDVVQLLPSTQQLRYRIHLGFGVFADWITVNLDATQAQLTGADLEDIDGDGLTDIVSVQGSTLQYWLNRNGGAFDARATVTSADVDGTIPDVTNQTVLFADMNGNGTHDIVWVNSSGLVRFLELFPVRPNLLSRIENGIGSVQVIAYGTSAAERARDEATAPWLYTQPNAMNVVTRTDTWVTLTGDENGVGLHQVRTLEYRDGYYDGDEKDFRGFETVRRRLLADAATDSQEPALEVLRYDVGQTDDYMQGKLLVTQVFGGPDTDVPLREVRNTYTTCAVDEVGTPDPEFPVRFVCPETVTTILQEGAASTAWVTTQTSYEHDGYGNVSLETQAGVVHRGPPEAPTACAACGANVYGACGAQCIGDELMTETTYAVHGADTSGAWIVSAPVRVESYGSATGPRSEQVTYYDGADFMGLPEGQLTSGLVSRVTDRVSATEVVATQRNRYDANGNVIEALDPLSAGGGAGPHRRTYTMDALGIRVARVDIHLEDNAGTAYTLTQSVLYEADFLEPSDSTSYQVMRGSTELTPRNSSQYRYDEFGRVNQIIRPGDSAATPTETFTYELADPVTRIAVRSRRTVGGALDTENYVCLDGLGRTVQTRTRVAAGRYLVDGFVAHNAQGTVVREYQPYESTSANCEETPPSGVAFTAYRFDAIAREVASTEPDTGLYGSASSYTTVYGPLTTTLRDPLDNDATHPHANTPVVQTTDGLGRIVSIERVLAAGTAGPRYGLRYDSLGRVVSVFDPEGNEQQQTFDLLNRPVTSTNPNSGTSTFTYDAGSNVVRLEDGRGRVTERTYDGLNRVLAEWDSADRSGTETTRAYDYLADCSSCTNGAGNIVRSTFPIPGDTSGGAEENGYDARGRRVHLGRTLEGVSFVTSFQFDGAGSLVGAQFPDGQTLAFTLDDAGRPTGIDGLVTSASYDARGTLSTVQLENGVSSTFEYDALERLSRIQHGASGARFFDVTLTRDRDNNVTALADGATESAISRDETYAYDAWRRVVEAQLGGMDAGAETLTFAYDDLDNLTSRTSSLGSSSLAHVGALAYASSRPNAVTQVGGMTLSYDAAGQVSQRGGAAMIWSHVGRLLSSDVATDTREATEFVYSALGDRVMKFEEGGVVYYPAPDFEVRDGVSQLYARLDSKRVARLRGTTLGTEVLADANGDSRIDIADATLSAGGEGASNRMRLLRASARRLLAGAVDDVTYLHTDAVGSIVAATDSSGDLVAERAYYPFGMLRTSTGYVDEHGFTGQEEDATTGLLYFRERYLDPFAGRWTAVDPLFGVLDGSNVARLGESTTGYAYVANNPVNTVDPDGLAGRSLVKRAKAARRKAHKARRRAVARGEQRGVTFGEGTVNNARTGSTPNVTRVAPPNPKRTYLRRETRDPRIRDNPNHIPPRPIFDGRNPQTQRSERSGGGGLDRLIFPHRRRGRDGKGGGTGILTIVTGIVFLAVTVGGGIAGGFAVGASSEEEEEGDSGGGGGLSGIFGG
ncbi:MAG: toxin TcdB middle/N-terminal domain-containing protein [Polyangiales bacterium]